MATTTSVLVSFVLLPFTFLTLLTPLKAATFTIGIQLKSGQTWTINVPAGTTDGRVWTRTGCSFDASGNGHCETGDCGDKLSCTAYISLVDGCPAELKAPGGSNNACTVFKMDEYCCNSGSCEPTDYSRFSYSYPKDDQTSTFTWPT